MMGIGSMTDWKKTGFNIPVSVLHLGVAVLRGKRIQGIWCSLKMLRCPEGRE
jgi:hypothetical protein